MSELRITLKKKTNHNWVIEKKTPTPVEINNKLIVSLPVNAYHKLRVTQSLDLKRTKQKLSRTYLTNAIRRNRIQNRRKTPATTSAIEKILRQNNVEITMKDINNNNNASTCEPSLHTRHPDDNMNQDVEKTDSNKNRERNSFAAAKESETQTEETDDILYVEEVPMEVPAAPFVENLYRWRDFNNTFVETEMSRTHNDYPSYRKNRLHVERNYEPYHCLAYHNPSPTGLYGPEMPMMSSPVLPTTIMRFDSCHVNQYSADYKRHQPMMYPNILRNPVPCQVRGPMHHHHRSPPWPSPRNQFLRQPRPRFNPMARQTYIDDPRRRPRQ